MDMKVYNDMCISSIYEQLGALRLISNPKFNNKCPVANMMNDDIMGIINKNLNVMYYNSRYEVSGVIKMYFQFVHFKFSTVSIFTCMQYLYKPELRPLIKPIFEYYIEYFQKDIDITSILKNDNDKFINNENAFALLSELSNNENIMKIDLKKHYEFYNQKNKRIYIKYDKVYELFSYEYNNNPIFKKYVDIYDEKISNIFILIEILNSTYGIIQLENNYMEYTSIINDFAKLITFSHKIYIHE